MNKTYDMKSDHQPEQATGTAAEIPSWANECGALFAQHVFDHRRSFTDPFEAICTAWEYDHDPTSEFIEHLRGLFPETLAAQCGCSPDKLSGNPSKAFNMFMAVLVVSLRVWRCEPLPGGLYGSVVAHWYARHPEIFSKVQEAFRLRARAPKIEKAAWTLSEVVSAHGAGIELPESGKLELSFMEHFSGQRTWMQAAQTAAYALFGDFLIAGAESTGFCKHCARPFLRSRKRFFCSHKCGNAHSKVENRKKAKRTYRSETFRKVSKALTKWLQGSRNARSGWCEEVQNAAGLQTRDGRQNRSLGEYIRASRTEVGSPERVKLLQAILYADIVPDSQKISKENENLQRELDTFLLNIQEAEEIRQRSNRK